MFNQLTKYLLQYRTVSIPHVGTIQLVQQSSQLNFENKTIQPPFFAAELKEDEDITEHQLNFLAASLNEEKETIGQALKKLGWQMHHQVQGEGFEWKGIGLIRQSNEAMPISVAKTLAPVPAERVVRVDTEQNVLGEQDLSATTVDDLMAERQNEKKGISILMLVGWLVLFIAILFIVFVLFFGNFRIHSAGSKQPIEQVNK